MQEINVLRLRWSATPDSPKGAPGFCFLMSEKAAPVPGLGATEAGTALTELGIKLRDRLMSGGQPT